MRPRHSIALRSYIHATRAVDPVALERARMLHMSTPMPGFFPRGVRGIAYVLVQELATRVAHRSVSGPKYSSRSDHALERLPIACAKSRWITEVIVQPSACSPLWQAAQSVIRFCSTSPPE